MGCDGGYKVVFDPRAAKALEKMDGTARRMILAYIKKRLVGCENPRAFGKGLSNDRAGEWRYRVGAYRILAFIDDGKVTIYVTKIGDRRDVYDN